MNNLKVYLVFPLVFFLNIFFSFTALANNVNIGLILQKKYNEIHSISTEYIQELTNHLSHETTIRKGKIFILKKKGTLKIRWETISPEKEILFVSGDVVWDYIPGDNIAYKYRLKDVADSRTILDLISGKINISREFVLSKEDISKGPYKKYKLIPHRPEPNMVLVYLWISRENLIHQIEIIDFFGNTNTITLKNTVINQGLDPGLFVFRPNKDTQILEGVPGGGQ